MSDSTVPLFDRYPETRAIAHVPLGCLPTPVMSVDAMARAAGARSVWVKRDDLSGVAYGGNKVRKLEFLLGEALQEGATDVITFGAAGSNHALATALYGASLGLDVHSMLMPQHSAPYVARNLRASAGTHADLHYFADLDGALRGAAALRSALREQGGSAFVIPFGGTTPTSTLGFVNAGLELAGQVEAGALPEPDSVYVALGSMGTAAGLALGLRAAGLRTRVVAVSVIADEDDDLDRLLALVRETQDLLVAIAPSFPSFAWDPGDVEIGHGFVGEAYAVPTPAGAEAVGIAEEACGIDLDGTYTGKALSALLAHGRDGRLAGRDVVFWDTYNSRDIGALVEEGRGVSLPEGLRDYLQADVADGQGPC